MSEKITIETVARAAGVSISTVSRVINRQHTGDPEIRARVLRVIQELDYRPSESARSLARKPTESMGFVMHSLVPMGTYYGDILSGAEEEARKNNYHLYFSASHHTLAALSTGSAPEAIGRGGLDGVIYAGDFSPDLLDTIRQASPHLVLVNSLAEGEEIDSVMCDNFSSARRAVQHLMDLEHRHVACIVYGSGTTVSGRERVLGYRQALSDTGIPIDERLIVVRSGSEVEVGYEAMSSLLRLRPRPTAVFGTIDEVAVGAIRCAKDAGLRVPEDLSVVGVNDLDIARYCDPSLTTVRIFRREMGRVAVRRLLELIREPLGRPMRTDVLCEFVERESCARVDG